jgi:hypothetical protein
MRPLGVVQSREALQRGSQILPRKVVGIFNWESYPSIFYIEVRMKLLNTLIFAMPSVVGALYFFIAICYLLKRDYAWALVWASYALANVGLVLIGLRGNE